MTTGIFGIPIPDPDAAKRAKEQAEEAAKRAVAPPAPRPRVPCRACYPRRGWVLADHVAKRCVACGGMGTIEEPL